MLAGLNWIGTDGCSMGGGIGRNSHTLEASGGRQTSVESTLVACPVSACLPKSLNNLPPPPLSSAAKWMDHLAR
jgi:hypothetical protein